MRSEDIKIGWRIVAGLLGLMLFSGALGQLANLMRGLAGGQFNLLSAGIYAIQVWLCWNVYQGKDWARLLLGFMLVMNALMLFMVGAPLPALLPLLFAVSLFVIPQVNAYFEYAKHQ